MGKERKVANQEEALLSYNSRPLTEEDIFQMYVEKEEKENEVEEREREAEKKRQKMAKKRAEKKKKARLKKKMEKESYDLLDEILRGQEDQEEEGEVGDGSEGEEENEKEQKKEENETNEYNIDNYKHCVSRMAPNNTGKKSFLKH